MAPGGECQNGGTCQKKDAEPSKAIEFLGEMRNFGYELYCLCAPGFKGSFCEQVDETQPEQLVKIIVPSIATSFLLVVIIVAAVQYQIRRMRIQDELANTDWRVKWEDLFFQPDQRPFGWIGRGSSVPVNDARTGSMIRVGSVMTPLPDCAIFKGQMVAVKRVNKIGLKVTEELLAEIRFMRSTRHVNIIPFIGVCIDLPHILILTEYTTKGSLRDVLSNADIRLDWGFRYSLARDLAQGMDFLHHSDAQWHGKLTSNNCLIDSHWVLKITDFGLHLFKQGEQPADDVLEVSFNTDKLDKHVLDSVAWLKYSKRQHVNTVWDIRDQCTYLYFDYCLVAKVAVGCS
jgi:serine/threonine protein kinase